MFGFCKLQLIFKVPKNGLKMHQLQQLQIIIALHIQGKPQRIKL